MRLDAHLHRLRTLALCSTALAVLGLAPAAASAATVSVSSGVLTYTAATGEANSLTIAPSGSSYQVTETGTRAGSLPIAVTAGAGCALTAPGRALCGGVKLLNVSAGDGNDVVDASQVTVPATIDGGAGNDRLSGGSGGNVLIGGTGDDAINARNGAVDGISCGSGTDSVTADTADIVAPDCESVDRAAWNPAAPSGSIGLPVPNGAGGASTGGGSQTTLGGGTTSSGDLGTTDPAAPVIPPQTVTVTPQGDALVQVLCPQVSGGCQGTVTLEVPADALGGVARVRAAGGLVLGARRRRMVKLGTARFRAAAGQKLVVRVPLARRGRWRVLRGHRTSCRVTVTTQVAGGKTSVSTRQITLVARREVQRGRGR